MTRRRAVGIVALVGTVLLLLPAVLLRAGAPLPATIDLQGLGTTGLAGRTPLAAVLRGAVLVPALAAAVGVLVTGGRTRIGLLVVDGAAAPIVVFLVAQLNGVSDAGALVLTYAATAGAVLMRGLQERDRGGRPAELPLWFAAMLGIVPWGVIALHQVGTLVSGGTVPGGVQATTLVVLAATVAEFVVSWRGRRGGAPSTAETALVVAPPLLLAILGVLVVR